jgi:hypothetical protein
MREPVKTLQYSVVVTLHLRRPRVEDAEQALAAHREFLDCPYIDFLIDFNEGESFADWVRRMNGMSGGINVPRDWVRGEFLFIEVDGTVVGRLSIRYELNGYLREFEGHIGYAVLSRYRRRATPRSQCATVWHGYTRQESRWPSLRVTRTTTPRSGSSRPKAESSSG